MLRRVACAISGGVDSAVSALLMKQKGYDVVGVFMKNWDLLNEHGNCTLDKDRDDAIDVCGKLGIPFHEVSFVKEYWNDVFVPMLGEYENGQTPNPDVMCNRHIKFDALVNYAVNTLGVDSVATGHYARISGGNDLSKWNPHEERKLLKASDTWKDQTLFLSRIQQAGLRRAIFPIGGLQKTKVKDIARGTGLERIANKKESVGICFIEQKKFHSFIEQYIEPKNGQFICVETGKVIGEHKGTHYWTVGQCAKIGGYNVKYFIVHIDPESQNITVAAGTHHPALFSTSLSTELPHWISQPPCDFTSQSDSTSFKCQFRFQHIHPIIDCQVHHHGNRLDVDLNFPLRALTSGQYAVFYNDLECLGSAKILHPGPSLYDMDHREPVNIPKAFS
ncbi:unnamed protein product [Owenia fusiformis]|uniref:tRNA-5-taurinomethyluridine 2-sulfurtransferase n=1 Tax=Owenia fusiformis TaxID=6347 RepID=A0A8J1T8V8_OWEFU|nr:unnamed protein product [Owenia fusiformis]